ncbi:DNA phosphorothioation system sulfurtransferase DndC [Phormidium sp. CLA17]|uniref:DNA phosphorothioation system sulfurtransferase DndC n=1 Tax=Leptolyngbya sp. Cla-17 TaxID=2803751 RepID=UPI001491F8E9|nr:DNA phosphorothioation system sulfurtransferase DndC [Leptolyngbya sp. Cla-17]MBM0740242.1 DNA phosphorothioation system sulfurtransferase DndC [Leptolyngbya sp. Cla-17]
MIAQPEVPQDDRRTVPELIEDIKALTKEIQALYCLDEIPWVIGYSGGKDSSAVLQLVWNAIAELPAHRRTKPIHVLTTDTLVENPIVTAWVRKSLDRIRAAAQEQELPFEPHLLYPEVKDTFWVNLIGKGYPAPRHMFRWCTERLKIWPSNRFINNVVRTTGEVIIVLGTRKAESSRRAGVMAEHEVGNISDRLPPQSSEKFKGSLLYRGPLPGSLIYSPVEDWRDDEVWLYLMQWQSPWGHNNKDLFAMYRGATADNECPFVIDTSTPSCGDSRFGCWVCTLISEDKSMTAMIQNDVEKEWMQPLLDLRNELDVYDDHDRRDFRRMTGRVQLFERNIDKSSTEVIPIPGPYTKYWREEWLRRVLQAQKLARQSAPQEMKDIKLISMHELSEIRRIWREEKHEFNDSLPRIYREVTGEIFNDSHPETEQALLGNDEWKLLEELCEGDFMHLELMSKLLDTERQYQLASNRSGILKDLKKCFDTSSRDKEAAIHVAHRDRDLKQAVQDGDAEAVKQLTEATQESNIEVTEPPNDWAAMKFGKKGASSP